MVSQGKYELASLQNPRDAFSNNKEKIRRMQENAIFFKRNNKKETNPRKVYFTSWTPDVAVTSKGTREREREAKTLTLVPQKERDEEKDGQIPAAEERR